MKICINCSRNLKKDEIALNKKMLGKNTKQFLCLDCLSEYLNTDQEILLEKIEQFKEEGCTLFLQEGIMKYSEIINVEKHFK